MIGATKTREDNALTHPLTRVAAVLATTFASVVAAQAQTVAEFYKDKSISIIVGYGAGGGYDVYARAVARHMGRHIPGAPAIVVQNMPGAGSLRAANHIYNAAPKDGTALATFGRNMPMLGVLGGNPNVQFDARKFTWIGSPTSAQDDSYMLWVRRDAKTKTLEAATKPGGEALVLGGTAEGSTDTDVAVLMRMTIGLNAKVITGYPDSNAINLALERGEVEGRFIGKSAVASTKPEWLKPDGLMVPFLQFARATRHPEFPNVPTAREKAKDATALRLIELAEIPYVLSRPIVGPPNIPADRAKALQDALLAMCKDPVFLQEAEKLKIDVSPVGPAEALEMLNRLAEAPQELKDEIKKLQGGG
jgi:tripartite-type tricarboxylate transporter receptor subunit TctC